LFYYKRKKAIILKREILDIEQEKWIKNNIQELKISSYITDINTNYLYYCKGDIQIHLDFLEELFDLPNSFLDFKYFNEIFKKEEINENGNYTNKNIILSSIIEVILIDGGKIILMNNNLKKPIIYVKQNSDLLAEYYYIFDEFEFTEEEILDYFYLNNLLEFNYNDNSAYIKNKKS